MKILFRFILLIFLTNFIIILVKLCWLGLLDDRLIRSIRYELSFVELLKKLSEEKRHEIFRQNADSDSETNDMK